MALSADQQLELQTQLQRAVIECNERCLYFAAKWYTSDTTISFIGIS
jgi:anaphase-promoting complex subunit 8